ncbi:phosphate acyltransferase PlsX [Maritimibacter sp. HL-12]|uniref:phosphate acyltransferase PlsX n=1 Tax=Maritimibacter sp. HL-12 TaxID=1162418 RepID=UPI000A0F2791|nr:phosphate acyltransferase PlsX [Maritimibacter sp. HL-12]SMH30203.1 phosphate:acyl-[acyl carrier protein] acyltransferase [Maritimibacter sp. HL-12]
MSAGTDHPQTAATGTGPRRTVISVDAMGGDRGPEAIVSGLAKSARKNPDIAFILHGDEAELTALVGKRPELAGRVDIRHADGVVSMEDKPAQVLRNGKGSSMWSTIEAVRDREAEVAVSCGNTGALMVLSMMRLRKLPGVNRPAIACYWPSKNPAGFNVMLDVGADVRADEHDLLQYALMGTSYARNSLGLERPRVGLLNVGTEEHKGRSEIKAAADLIAEAADAGEFEFVGNVEGSDIPSRKVDVIVTDGFTGNVALKTAEGTAGLFKSFFKEAFRATLPARIGALFAARQLKILTRRTDPRQVNGGVFLGLNGTVVKSHGSADSTGIAAAVNLAFDLARHDFNHKLAARVASVPAHGQDGATSNDEQDETAQ